MKEIKDYLHLYLGCQCQCVKDMPASYGWITGITVRMDRDILWDMTEPVYFAGILLGHFYDFIKPILRPLSSMTEDEIIGMKTQFENLITGGKIPNMICRDAQRTHYLLSKQFDLFGLIESGLAIDATTLTP